jgi:hypothetical protein
VSIETFSLILVIVLAIFSSITAPLMLAHRTERMHTKDREADWLRQDAVAEKAAKAARDLVTNQQTIAEAAAEAARLLLEKQIETTRAQQEVARQAAKAAELLLKRQDESDRSQQEVAKQAAEAARLLLANNERVAETQEQTNGKLDVIHVLVNSTLTAALQGEMDATVREVTLMKEVLALNRAAGREPSVEALAAIDVASTKIEDLRMALADRIEATDKAAELNPGPGIITITTRATEGHEDP